MCKVGPIEASELAHDKISVKISVAVDPKTATAILRW